MTAHEAWQNVKQQLDKNLGKGFSDKTKTGMGELLDRYEKMIAQLETDSATFVKLATKIDADIEAARTVLKGVSDAWRKFTPTVVATKNAAAIEFMKGAEYKIMG